MNMHSGLGRLHGPQDVDIGLSGVVRMDPALEADLGRALRPGFRRSPGNLLKGEIVRPVACSGLGRSLGERTEAAAIGADVCVVDISIDDVRYDLALSRPAHFVSRSNDRLRGGAPGREQRDQIARRQRLPSLRPRENTVKGAVTDDRRRRAKRTLD